MFEYRYVDFATERGLQDSYLVVTNHGFHSPAIERLCEGFEETKHCRQHGHCSPLNSTIVTIRAPRWAPL